MSSNISIPHLHVLLASDAPVGLVMRRGPSKFVCTIGWNRRTDQFTIGQWLKGRVYERCSDLSPDGRYLLYFALNGRWDGRGNGSYNAMSRAPYLKTIGMWPKGDTAEGGGLFLDNRQYWLSGSALRPLQSPPGLKQAPAPSTLKPYGHEGVTVYYTRLQRDAWQLVRRDQSPEYRTDVFEKEIGQGWKLRKLAHAGTGKAWGKGSYYDTHELQPPGGGAAIAFPDWEWADVDGQRLVWAEAGKLFAGTLTASGVSTPALLHDFNGMSFKLLPAPY